MVCTQRGRSARAHFVPGRHLAMLRADAKTADAAREFLEAAAACAAALPGAEAVAIYAPVPLHVARVADVERMQMLVESASRPALQRFLAHWLAALHALKRERGSAAGRVLRWAIDVDPSSI